MPCDLDEFVIYPMTRYQGSKRKALNLMYNALTSTKTSSEIEDAYDLFSGSGVVSLMLGRLCSCVHSNDYMTYATLCASVFMRYKKLTQADIDKHIKTISWLITNTSNTKYNYVEDNYDDIYFTQEENKQIDNFCQNILTISSDITDLNLYRYLMGQAMLKKRPYNLFHRANLNLRLCDVKRSFGNQKTWSTSFLEHMVVELQNLNKTVCGTFACEHKTSNINIGNNEQTKELLASIDSNSLLYLDPPYLNKNGRTVDYCDFYHFLDGLLDYTLFSRYDINKKNKPILTKQSDVSNIENTWGTFSFFADTCKETNSKLVISYHHNKHLPVDALLNHPSITNRQSIVISTEVKPSKYVLSNEMKSEYLLIIQ